MPLIAAHRGACGGNIPCNTIASFDAAICQGADIIEHKDEITGEMLKRPLNYVGVEALFSDDSEPIAAKEYVDEMHGKNLIVWGNAIVYDINDVIAGGHNDDISAAGNPDDGWGWLIDRGYDIIQTDWTMMLKAYMRSR